MRKSGLLVLIILVLCAGCNLFKKKKRIRHFSPYVEKLFVPDLDFFRNTHLGMPLVKVKTTEKIKPANTESNLLRYEILYPKDSTTYEEYADIEYNFNDDDKLDIITGNIYTSHQQLADSIYRDITRYLQYNFGTHNTDDYHYDVWKVKSINYAEDSILLNVGIIQKHIEDEYIITYEIMQD